MVMMWGTSSPSLLKHVNMNADVFMVCLQHALSTEKEEVMGLLLGEIDNSEAHISALLMLRRSDKRKDRVEISPEQLSGATEHAERLTEELKQSTRVIGWYHSHPHITVWPSHVDVRTQFSYQMLDQGFVGIIFSVFSEVKSKEQEIHVTCFQSMGSEGQLERRDIDLFITPAPAVSYPCLQEVVKLAKILVEEETDAHEKACKLAVNNILASVHNDAELTKALCHITELVSLPQKSMIEDMLYEKDEKLFSLQKERDMLLAQLNQF